MIPAEKNIMLEIRSLLIGYGKAGKSRPLLPPLNARAAKGELVAVIGRNGIGKSTLLRTVVGLLAPLGGSVIIDGKNLHDYNRTELALKAGYISTEQVRIDSMKVAELVELGRYPHTSWNGRLTEEDMVAIDFAVKKTGLTQLAGRFVNELSDGERQKAMIARVIAQDTGVIIMDEPTAFLDIISKFSIIQLLRSLADEKGSCVLFSTHDLQMALNECDRLWIIGDDSFYDGAPEDLVLAEIPNRLFHDNNIVFSHSGESFGYRKILKGDVTVKGTGIQKYWTRKAVNRAGFRAVDDETDISIEVAYNGKKTKWHCSEKGRNVLVADSIYEMVQWLKKY